MNSTDFNLEYASVKPFGDSQRDFLVTDKFDGHQYFLKKREVYSLRVYEYLRDHHIDNTPVIYRVWESEGSLMILEEFITGITLSDYIEKKRHLTLEEAVELTNQLCDIVRELHQCDPPIIHRDIKPANIMITDDGRLILLDMDAAKVFSDHESRDTYLLGTYGYAAPEQYGFGKASVSSDIYSIGKVLEEMLTGDVNGEADGYIKAVIDRCTQIDPANRYSSVAQLQKELRSRKTRKNIDYNELPGFRSEKPVFRFLGFLTYACTILMASWASFTGVEGVYETWCYRIFYYLAFLMSFLFLRNYRYIWDKTGINHIQNRYLRILVIMLMSVGILMMTIMLAESLASAFAEGRGRT